MVAAVAERREAGAVTPSAAAVPASALISQDPATFQAAVREDFMAGPRAGFTAEPTPGTVPDLPAMATQPAGAAVPGAAAVGAGAAAGTGAGGAEPAGVAVTGAAASGPGHITVTAFRGSCPSCRWPMQPIGTAEFRTTTPMTSITPGIRPMTATSRPTRHRWRIQAARLTCPGLGRLRPAMWAHRIPAPAARLRDRFSCTRRMARALSNRRATKPNANDGHRSRRARLRRMALITTGPWWRASRGAGTARGRCRVT